MTLVIGRKDFISLRDIGAQEIMYVLDTAETMKYILDKKNKKAPYLQGKSVVLMFYESGARTKLSYEMAAQTLSADIVDMNVAMGASGGWNLLDMGKIVEQMGGDFIIIRHPMSGSAKLLAENVSAGVVNAGDGIHENPSQSLLDLLTIKMQKGGFSGLNVTIIGDIAHSRVTRSNIWGLLALGANITLCGPPVLVPTEWAQVGLRISYNLYEAVEDADVLMVLKMKTERQLDNMLPPPLEYRQFFKIDKKVLQYTKPDCIIMHPGPIDRGVEISSEIIDSKQCLLNDQIANSVAVRMALLYLMSMKGTCSS